MTYSVFWSLVALQMLERIVGSAADPDRVRAAVSRMEFMLRRYPHHQGESRDPGFRVWYEDVIGMYFWIDDAEMRVEVLLVGPTRRR